MSLHATNKFPGDGVSTTREFNFTGGYLSTAHVKVYIEDGAGARTDVPIGPANFLGPFTLQGLPVTPVGSTLVVYRDTPANYLVDFTNNTRITEYSLDVAARQGLFKAVEASEYAQGALGGTATSVAWDSVLGKPYASGAVPGIVRVGTGLTIDGSGALSVLAPPPQPPAAHTHAIADIIGLSSQLASKQPALVSGVNIKNINGVSLLGSGNLEIAGVGGAPSGPAGGVLSGSYPNPTFAEPMATSFDLQAELQAKSDHLHEHYLGALTQSGASVGQVPTWDGEEWVPATPSAPAVGVHKKVAVLGDSLSAEQANFEYAWPVHLERLLNAGGESVEVRNFSRNASSFYRANTLTAWGGKTAVQAVIDYAPAVVFVCLGFNDTVTGVDGRTVAQAQADAATTLSTLRAALPSACIVYVNELPFDFLHANPPSLNRHVLPIHMSTPASGTFAGMRSEGNLNNPLSAGTITAYTNWNTLNNNVSINSALTGALSMHYWKIARLGGTGPDGLHPNSAGSILQASQVFKGILGVPAVKAAFPNLAVPEVGVYTDFDSLFTDWLTDTGTSWADKTPSGLGMQVSQSYSGLYALRPRMWWNLARTEVIIPKMDNVESETFTWIVKGPPLREVFTSLDGAAWVSQGFADETGTFAAAGNLAGIATAGPHTMYYRAGGDVVQRDITIGPAPRPVNRSNSLQIYGGGTLSQAIGAGITRVKLWGNWGSSPGTSECTMSGDPTNGVAVLANVSGAFLVTFTCLISGGQTGQSYAAGLWRSDGSIFQGTNGYPPIANYAVSVTCSLIVRLEAGWSVFPMVSATGPGVILDRTPGPGLVCTHLTCTYVGA